MMFRLKYLFPLFLLGNLISIDFCDILAQATGDYRSRQTGTWTTVTSWQTYDGTNWINATTTPTSINGTITILSGHTITSNTNLIVDQVVVNSGGTLSITGGIFTLNTAVANDLDCNGTLAFSGGTVNGTGTIAFNNSSTFNWAGGLVAGSGAVNVNAGATLTMNSGNHSLGDTKTLNNYGTWNWTGGNFLFNNATPIVNNYATFNINTDADVGQNSANTGLFNNAATGIINKTGATTDETSFNNFSSFTNAGTINIISGRLRFTAKSVHAGAINIAAAANLNFSSGIALFNTGTMLSGTGSLNFESGNDSLYAGTVSVSNINMSGGTVSIATNITMGNSSTFNLSGTIWVGSGTVTFNPGSTLNWTGGEMAGTGITTINAGATFNMAGGTLYIGNTRTLNNYGTCTWTSGNLLYYAPAPVVNNYGTFNISTDADLGQYNANTGTFNNAATGIINKIGSPDNETSFNNISSFTNAGTININSSRLRFNIRSVHTGTTNIAFGANLSFSGAVAIFNTGTLLNGDGYLNFESGNDTLYAGTVSVANINMSGGTVSIAPSITMGDGSTFNLSGGILTGGGTINFNAGSTLNWTNGNMAGTGITNLNTGSAFNMDGGNLYLGETRTLNNYGNWNWNSGNFYYYATAPVINNYGTFNINTDADLNQANANTGSFNNMTTGIINKTGDPSTNTFISNISTFNNAGTVNISSGNFTLNVAGTHNGTYNIDVGSVLSGSITMPFTGTGFTNNGFVTLTGLTFSGSAIQSLYGTGSVNTLTISNLIGVLLTESQSIETKLQVTANSKLTVYRDLVLQ